MDATINEAYARMQAVFTVTDARTGKALWQEKVKATITDKEMTENQSVTLVNERIVKNFIKECFSKMAERSR